MNRSSSKDSLVGAGGRNHNNNNNHNAITNGILSHRRGMSFTKNNAAENFNSNNNMDLFSRSRTSLPAASSDESDLQVRLARLSVGSAKPAKSILDDLLSSNEGGKNDYDWLLTPPGTPLVPLEGKESQPARVTTRSRSSIRSSSINKTSRLSVSQSESNHPSRPARSSSVTRSSISTTQYTNYSNRNTNILNTSSASVSSYIRPSTPTKTTRPSTPSTTRTSSSSRPSTPSRTRPTPTSDRPTRPSGNTTRPSTPTSRPQTPGNSSFTSSSPTVRPPSRSATPTRRTLTPSLSPSTSSLPSVTRGLSTNGRSTVGSTSRPSSPSPRVRPPPQPINIMDFPHETPPNLRTTLPDRPLSAGRSRPGGSTTVKGNLDTSNSGTITRRHSSPNVVRGRIPEPSGRGRSNPNGHVVESLDPRRTSHLPQSLVRKPVKSSNSDNGTGFGRNISKKSLDMAIKHMDIRNGGQRPVSGSTLFPQSIRSTNSRAPPGRASSLDGTGSENGNYSNGYSWNRGGPTEDQSPHSSKLSSEVDIYESSRYDAILLKEDLKNTSWLHSADDKTDDGLLFDNGFESLPEPFGPL
ncbi:hypothetical protein L2E82_21236 [Cichorium intybus]|uniref:Uncharacterized protein n=1 Tax=Cichorium intybus TaxID=13427 RepID=A0ACB9DVR8_CICIN|nr:hypothetical protein L2E82_21236 [Cichorium intybus]